MKHPNQAFDVKFSLANLHAPMANTNSKTPKSINTSYKLRFSRIKSTGNRNATCLWSPHKLFEEKNQNLFGVPAVCGRQQANINKYKS